MFLMKCTISNWKFYKKDNRPSSSSFKKCIFTIYFVDQFQKSRTKERWKSSEIQLLDKKRKKKELAKKREDFDFLFTHFAGDRKLYESG